MTTHEHAREAFGALAEMDQELAEALGPTDVDQLFRAGMGAGRAIAPRVVGSW